MLLGTTRHQSQIPPSQAAPVSGFCLTSMPAFDLKQVGKLFNDTVSAIRDDTPDMDALEPQAIEWLKSARYKLMRDVEEAQVASNVHYSFSN
jgi:hypothetical protein